jgi:adenine-specific DNA-methyltransferase
MEIKENLTNNIIAPNNNLELLKNNFPHCFDKNGDFDFEKFKKELQSKEIDFSKESYGMDWLGKSYARLLASNPATTLLKEDKQWNSKEENKNNENLLIKGDNLEVLKHLSNAYHEQVKMIYIDPPYNTGSDGFVYEDDRKFTIQEFSELAGVDEEKAKKILSFVNSKSNSHSAWLTFMYPRLYIAKQILKDDGVIFVSIDDNEVAQLRILMDEIFTESGFLGQISWINRTKPKNIGRSKYALQQNTEYVLVYTKKDRDSFTGFCLPETYKKIYDADFNGEKARLEEVQQRKNLGSMRRDGMVYDLLGVTLKENYRWQLSQKERDKLLAENKLIKKGSRIFQYILAKDEEDSAFEPFWSHRQDTGTAESAKEYLENLMGVDEIFETVKPIDLIKQILLFLPNDEIFLDFFAGSGTTGDAVMQLNAEDRANGKEGKRKYILVQLPEPIDPKKNKTAYDFVKNELGVEEPTIFEITKERLVRAGKKIKSEQKADLFTGENKLDFGFKIFETMPIWEDYHFEAKEFNEQQRLFDESKLTSDDIQTLLTTWKTYDNIPLTQELERVDLDGYTGYYGKGKLYLMDKGFETKHLKALLGKIDEDTSFNPVSIIVFGYHFESKVLREIAENVSSYANKKKLDIDFITRY